MYGLGKNLESVLPFQLTVQLCIPWKCYCSNYLKQNKLNYLTDLLIIKISGINFTFVLYDSAKIILKLSIHMYFPTDGFYIGTIP
jgi:hypothetical protein